MRSPTSVRSLPELGLRVLQPFTAGAIDAATLSAVVVRIARFPDSADRDRARHLRARAVSRAHAGVQRCRRARHGTADGAPSAATTHGADGDVRRHRQRGRQRIPRHRERARRDSVSGRPREPDAGSPAHDVQRRRRLNVRAYAVAGSFDDCQRLVKDAFADTSLRAPDPSDLGEFDQRRPAAAADDLLLPGRRSSCGRQVAATHANRRLCCTPSGNFGNLTAGLMAKRAGVPIDAVRGRHERQ